MYEKIIEGGDLARAAYRDGIEAYLLRLEREAYASREVFVKDMATCREAYRKSYIEMLGIDKIDGDGAPPPCMEWVGENDLSEIYRVTVYPTKEIPFGGLFFVPHGTTRAPLVIAQHGGGGTPELCSDLNGKNNYNGMVRRLLARGAVVFAPQLLLWNVDKPNETQRAHGIPYQRGTVNKDLSRFGMSITALEIKGIMDAITYLCTLPVVEKEKISMVGISYGGYFTLHTMAADTRIRAGFSNACFNDRAAYAWQDWSYFDGANRFHDAEVAALCAPRKLFVAVGKEDAVFAYPGAVTESARAAKYFAASGCPENFVFRLWEGGHTMPSDDEGVDFILNV